MRVTAWRIVNKKHAAAAFSGEGARIYGGRWNPVGHVMIYTAQNLSLAILELIVHLNEYADMLAYTAIPVEFAEIQTKILTKEELPQNWSSLPLPQETQVIGKAWLDGLQSLVLKVPSAIVPGESNYLINPMHPDFQSLAIGPPLSLQIDPRLAAKLQ
jgi:RES domain-containing protein